MKNLNKYIVRRSSDFSPLASKQWDDLSVRPIKRTLIQKIFGGGVEHFHVPKGPFERVVQLEDGEVEVIVQSTDERVKLFPRIHVLGVAELEGDRGQEVLLTWILPYYDEQLEAVRRQVHDVFRKVLGIDCEVETLNSIVTSESARNLQFAALAGRNGKRTIRQYIADELGLDVEWKMQLGEHVRGWHDRLKAELSSSYTAVFNSESRTAQFRLKYSVKVEGVLASSWHIAQRRSRGDTGTVNAAAELASIHATIHQVLDPAFGVFGGREKVWEHPKFWEAIRFAFAELVVPRIAKEYGYVVSFTDFKRERTEAELDVLKTLETQDWLQQDFDHWKSILQELLKKQKDAILGFADTPDPAEVKLLSEKISVVRTEVTRAQKELETVSTGNASALSSLSHQTLTTTLNRFFSTLKLEAPKNLMESQDDAEGTEGAPTT